MGGPAGQVIYTFTPPGDEWTQTHTHTHANATATVSDTYDLNLTADAGAATGYVALCKQADNLGPILRLKFSFSLSQLPDVGESEETTIVDLGWVSGLGVEVLPVVLRVDYTGKLLLYFSGALNSGAHVIAAGTTYGLEVYYRYDPAHVADTIVQVYVDDELWISDSNGPDAWESFPDALIHVRLGWDFDYVGPCAVTLHAEDIVWTIEGTAQAFWMVY